MHLKILNTVGFGKWWAVIWNICTAQHMGQTNPQRQMKNSTAVQASLLILLCPACLIILIQAFIKTAISTVQTFQDSAYRITLWQLMICRIQLTVCKHKKAVGNEKKSKNKQNRQSIHESMTFDYHWYYGYFSLTIISYTFKFYTTL